MYDVEDVIAIADAEWRSMGVVPRDRDTSFAHGRFVATPEWQRGAVVLDVAAESSSIMFGLGLASAGKVWISDVSFQVVDASVPLSGETAEPAEPVNLGFQE